jgi:uncharacterized membrane protein YhaH (DUF805 family)
MAGRVMTSPKRSTERSLASGSSLWALFSFAGRMKRLDFLLASLALAIGHVVLVILALAVTRGGMKDPSGYAVRGIIDLALLWPSAAIAAKRGHDRNRPAARSILLIGLVYGAGAAMGYLLDAGLRNVGGACGLFALAGWVYVFIDYGLIDGTPGTNPYGPSPRFAARPGVGDHLAGVFD